jgi:hypothetical protein
MKTEVTVKETSQHIDIKIQINCCVYNVLDIERLLDRFLADIRNPTSCSLLTGMECALERLDMKPERLVADDGKEHYFIPKLHRALENIKTKSPFQILRMVSPLSEIQKKGTSV